MPTSNGGRARELRDQGVTLIELIIASSLTALVATAVCGVYVYALRLYERGQAANSAYVAATLGVDRMARLVENAVDAHASSYGRLTIWLPMDQDSDGHHLPCWVGNSSLRYRPGDQITFYLSDTTGNAQLWHGNILWRSVNGQPDPSWSLLPGGTQGRVAPVTELLFWIATFDTRKRVCIAVRTEQTYGNKVYPLTISRYVYLRNHN